MSRKFKGSLLPSLVLFVAAHLCFSSLFAQQQVIWTDGTPAFTRLDSTLAVRVDDVIQLNFTRSKSTEPDNFSLHLDGVDKVFSNTAQPLDFIPLPDREDLYLITDAFARRIFIVRASDGAEITEFRGPGNPDSALTTPVSGRAFLQGSSRKLLVTDQAKHRIYKFDYDDKSTIWFFPPVGAPASAVLVEPSAAVSVRSTPGTSEILIADTGKDRLLHVSIPDSSSDNYQIEWEWGQGILSEPADVEVSEDTFVIADKGNNRVLIVQPVGQDSATVLYQFPQPNTQPGDDTYLNAPEDVQVLSNGNLLIADTGNRRLIEVDRNHQIVWRFLGELREIRSAHRLSSGRTLAVTRDPRSPENSSLQPIRLGYSTQTFVSEINVLAQPVDYDTLSWSVNQPAGTGLRFQIRTAASTGDLVNPDSLWLGPAGPLSYYELNDSPINILNDGKQIFQYRVQLTTNDPLFTPEITDVELSYRFFDPNIEGVATSEVIQDTSGRTIISWGELQFETNIPADPAQRDDIQLEVRILDAQNNNAILESFQANNTSRVNLRTLSTINALRGKQALRLQAVFQTNNASISPVLDNWQIKWDTTTSTRSQIKFTNAAGQDITSLRTQSAAESRPGRTGIAFVTLDDKNLIPLYELIDVNLQTTSSNDLEKVTLKRQPTGEYALDPGIRVVIQNDSSLVIPNNGVVEARNRDVLFVNYLDSTSLSVPDFSTDSLLVLQFTAGSLFVETKLGTTIPLDSKITFKDTLFLRITDEFDRDLSAAQDTIFAEFFDNITTDVVSVMLTEEPNENNPNLYTTGTFASEVGVPVVNSAVGIRSDRKLQTRPNHQIGARYIDFDTLTTVYTMDPDTTDPTIFVLGDGAFDFLFAPNPYRANSGQTFRLRMQAFTGDIALQKIEIYNLAGEKVRTIDVNALDMDRGISIQKESRSTSRNQWWDLKTDDNALSSSGTYWAKFYVQFDDGTEPAGQRVLIRKFILIQ